MSHFLLTKHDRWFILGLLATQDGKRFVEFGDADIDTLVDLMDAGFVTLVHGARRSQDYFYITNAGRKEWETCHES